MAIPTNDQLRAALNHDLRKVGQEGLEKVVDEATRRIFSARTTGAILEFGHKQADPNYWTGIKYYASGPSSRIRFRRTPMAEEVVVRSKAGRKPKLAPAVAIPMQSPAHPGHLMNTTLTAVETKAEPMTGKLGADPVRCVIDAAAEDAYWREHHAQQPFASKHTYDAYAPAYRTGYEGYARHAEAGREFEAVEPALQLAYERFLARSSASGRDTAVNAAAKAHITWGNAKEAARAAWDRVRASEALRQ